MSTPESKSFEDQVKEVLENTPVGDDGKLQFAEDVPEALQYAVRTTKRFRDTQAAYTKSNQRAKTLEAENEKLAQSWEADAVANLSDSDKAKLEEMKAQDPEAWRQEITRLEEEQKTKFQEKRKGISEEVSQMTELERREAVLEQFNADNPDVQITDDVIENDIPPRISNKLKKGEITFEDFLEEVKGYLGKSKVIKKEEQPGKQPGFHKAAGGADPDPAAVARQSDSDYNSEIF